MLLFSTHTIPYAPKSPVIRAGRMPQLPVKAMAANPAGSHKALCTSSSLPSEVCPGGNDARRPSASNADGAGPSRGPLPSGAGGGATTDELLNVLNAELAEPWRACKEEDIRLSRCRGRMNG